MGRSPISNENSLARRTFLKNSGASLLGAAGLSTAAVSALLAACSGSTTNQQGDNTPLNGGACLQNGSRLETTGVTEGHTHTIQLTAAQIAAANPNVIFMTSSVGHTHPVQLTSAQYASLQTNQGISTNTGAGGDGHTHTLVINCL